MIIIALSDIHGNIDGLSLLIKELKEADLVLISGDITNFKGRDHASRIISAIEKHNPNILAVPGNCDLPPVDRYLSEKGINLRCNHIEKDGYVFAGANAWLQCPQVNSDDPEADDFAECLEYMGKNIDSGRKSIMVTHQPALGTEIDCIDGNHHGSRHIRDFIVKYQPLLAVSGHIHEAAGVGTLGSTVLVNPGPFANGSYARIEISDKVELAEIRHIGL